MDAKFVNPFIASTANALKTMTGQEITRGVPFVKGSFEALADVSGVIGLAGDATGSVVLSFPFGLAGEIYQALTGEPAGERDPAIADVVGEIANMVAGGAKAAFADLGVHFRISVPSVVVGPLHTITGKSDTPCIVIPFQLGSETFWTQFSFKITPAQEG